LVHPLLLQKQSDVSQTRKEGESAVYRNWATGHGTPVRPSRRLHRLATRTS
jgi:long-chain acyl-CoA synthetase